jgi:hypothetical protein
MMVVRIHRSREKGIYEDFDDDKDDDDYLYCDYEEIERNNQDYGNDSRANDDDVGKDIRY